MNDLIHDTTEEAHHSNWTIAVVIGALILFVCLACMIAAGVILSAKGLLFSCLYFLPVPAIFQGQISTETPKG